jgi:aminobenzoyl-glutamate utilization protein B
LLGEYDALSGMSQKAVSQKEAVSEGAPGHGCGHNLLGTAALGAALALKQYMETDRITGTIIFFGCPAEEIMTGKIRMAAAGCFDGLDTALSWHPWQTNVVLEQNMLAMNTARFTFYGTASHASAAPERGRSALDAVEIMNVGVNYLREHIPTDVRIHYSITDGGGEPNLVHARAQSWYYIRAPRRDRVENVFERVCKAARGAAMMTDTRVEIELLTGCWHPLPNQPLNELLHQCLEAVKAPVWTEEEQAFAAQAVGKQDALGSGVLPLTGKQSVEFASTDVSDVSWIVPVGQFGACTAPAGAFCHTWQFVACAGMSIGQKGMLYAAKVLAMAGKRLLQDEDLIKRAKDELIRQRGDVVYKTVVPQIIE